MAILHTILDRLGYVVAHAYQFTERGLKYVENAQEYVENVQKSTKEISEDLSDLLTNEEAVVYLVNHMLDRLISQKQFPPDLPDYIRDSFDALEKDTKREWLTNVYYVFKYTKSPIEKIFLNHLILNAVAKRSPRIVFTPPSPSANTMMEGYRENYELVDQMFKDWCEEIGEASPDEETAQAFVKNIQLLDISQKQKDLIIYNFREAPIVHDIIHLTIQPTFDDILLEEKAINPDILIWVPSNPTVKLIVDCDDFNYHTSQSAFSNDRARDRLLLFHGFRVLRFSDLEITNNPKGTADELLNYLAKEFQPFARRDFRI